MSKATMNITVDDGKRRVPINNKAGDEIGVFYFRPSDVGIINRWNDVVDKFNDVITPLEKSEDPTSDALREAEKRLFELVDYLFDGNASEAFFGKMSPFSPVEGRFYCEAVLESVGTFIDSVFETETKKISRHVQKYTDKYSKDKKSE